jgi:hypothetical protein
MSRLDDLPPDQRAVLSLLLRQRKTYAEVAALLSIEERAVRDRAQAAVAVLAPRQARELTAERRESIGDYLLGQQAGVAGRLQTRTYLRRSAPGRAWARAISAELAPLTAAALPEIPAPGGGPAVDAHDAVAEPSAPAEKAAAPGGRRTATSLPSSRRAGALLLAAIAGAVIVAVVLITGGGGHSGGKASAGSSAASTSSASAGSTRSSGSSASAGSTGSSGSSAGKATEDKRITLTSPDPASKAIGVAEVLSEGSQYAFYLAAEHLPPSTGFFYAVWLYNSPTSHEALSRSPPVGADGRLQGGALLPANAGEYHTMLLTKETSSQPTHPGPAVLSGTFALH